MSDAVTGVDGRGKDSDRSEGGSEVPDSCAVYGAARAMDCAEKVPCTVKL